MILILARHGETFDDKTFTIGINQNGYLKTNELAQELILEVRNTKPVSHIYSSPLIRCLQSVQTISLLLNIPIRLENSLFEYYTEEQYKEEVMELPTIFKNIYPIDKEYKSLLNIKEIKAPESYELLKKRCQEFLTHIKNNHSDEDIVCLMTHLPVINILKDLLNDNNSEKVNLDEDFPLASKVEFTIKKE